MNPSASPEQHYCSLIDVLMSWGGDVERSSPVSPCISVGLTFYRLAQRDS